MPRLVDAEDKPFIGRFVALLVHLFKFKSKVEGALSSALSLFLSFDHMPRQLHLP